MFERILGESGGVILDVLGKLALDPLILLSLRSLAIALAIGRSGSFDEKGVNQCRCRWANP